MNANLGRSNRNLKSRLMNEFITRHFLLFLIFIPAFRENSPENEIHLGEMKPTQISFLFFSPPPPRTSTERPLLKSYIFFLFILLIFVFTVE